MLADHGQQRVALADALGKDVDEIAAGRDRIDVEEDVLPPEAARQTIVNPPRESAGVLAPIADEDAAEHVDVLAPKRISAGDGGAQTLAKWE